ncbi:hypothetical protein BOTBODRAFT_182080 [Botryobasidium botryosum FD-172 SS1]|uniref:Uncharacterized protein n=1 Tax=Botryobasidium botryosum (strain FD-172 SS1) TaxID=930990 RepID=A0A067M2Y5_BOTB1|nr:hypothetical protein BOTBODRAFT_182080 [Botryobasidium botryosum FD-172 SS1]
MLAIAHCRLLTPSVPLNHTPLTDIFVSSHQCPLLPSSFYHHPLSPSPLPSLTIVLISILAQRRPHFYRHCFPRSPPAALSPLLVFALAPRRYCPPPPSLSLIVIPSQALILTLVTAALAHHCPLSPLPSDDVALSRRYNCTLSLLALVLTRTAAGTPPLSTSDRL